MKNQDEFKKLFDQVASKKTNNDEIKKKIKAYSGSIEDVELLFAELNKEQTNSKTGGPKGFSSWVVLLCLILGVTIISVVAVIKLTHRPVEQAPTLTASVLIMSSATIIPPATQLTIPLTPTLPPTPLSASVQVIQDWTGLPLPVPVCFDTTNCIVWQITALPSKLPDSSEKLSLAASSVDQVTSIWDMVAPGFHLDGMVAAYLIDYSPYADARVPSLGLLNYSVNLDEQNLFTRNIKLTDLERENVWVPLGLYSVKIGQKLKIEANMKADSSYLPIGPMLVVRFSDRDQQRLKDLSDVIGGNQIVALLDEDSHFILGSEDKNWSPESGDGFGGDVIAIDEKFHKRLTWKLMAGLEAGIYDIYIYFPKANTDPDMIKCGEKEFSQEGQDGSAGNQWYKSMGGIEIPKENSNFEFSCDWNNIVGGEPVYLDAIAIVKRP